MSTSTSFTIGLIHALPFSERLACSRAEAASFIGVSVGYFDKLVREGKMPQPLPLPGVRRWDKQQLKKAFDALSGIDESEDSDNEWDQLTQ